MVGPGTIDNLPRLLRYIIYGGADSLEVGLSTANGWN